MTFEIFRKKLHEKISPETNISFLTKKGDAEPLINQTASETNADLIVMGIVGMSRIDEILIGSVSSSVIRSSSIPVLLIPGNAAFKNIQKIVFALDTGHLSGSKGLSLLKEIAQSFQAKVLILNFQEEDKEKIDIKSTGANLPAIFVNNLDYSISINESEDVVQGILNFAEENQADIVAMIPDKYSLIARLFNAGNTQKVAYNSKIPLLTLPDRIYL